MIQEFISSSLSLLTITIVFYVAGTAIYRRVRITLLHPVLLTFLAMIGMLTAFNIPYQTYREATSILDFGLGMSVVALGYLLYEQEERMRGQITAILSSITIGSIVGIVSVVFIARWLGADKFIENSIAMKSVTVPIAVGISERCGGDVSITSVVVFLTGIFGAIVGIRFLKLLDIKDSSAKGLAMGASAHGIGTARAIEEGATEGALSGLAMALMGVITSILTPIIQRFLF
jgi:predicted murein hydrolase (TIGR00659 family)